MNDNPENTGTGSDPEEAPKALPGGRIEYQPKTSVNSRAALVVQADSAAISGGAAGAIIANEASLSKGYATAMVARDLNLEMGGAQWLLAGEAHVHQGGAAIVVARDLQATDVKVGIILAGNVQGNVQSLMDRDAALRFGGALGAVLGIMLIIRRILH